MIKKNKSLPKAKHLLNKFNNARQTNDDLDFHEKKSHRKFRWAGMILTVFLIFSIVQCGKQYMRIQDMKDQLNTYKVAYTDAEAQQEKLNQQMKLFQNPSYLARVARDNLRMVKPGEYLIVPAEKSDALTLDETNIEDSKLH